MKAWFCDFISPGRFPPPRAVEAEPSREGEITMGAIVGPNWTIPIREGVPLLANPEVTTSTTARSFGFEWGEHLKGRIEADTSFGYSLEQEVEYFTRATRETPATLAGKTLLDAGCGSGRLTLALARMGAARVVGMDINTALFQAALKGVGQENLSFVQANLLDTGLAPESFDLIWSNGVIHHTPDPKRAFLELARLVKPGGKLYIWVYGTHFSPLVATRWLLSCLGLRWWPLPLKYRISQGLALLLAPVVEGVRLASLLIPALDRNPVARNIRDRWHKPGALTMIWFDILSPRYRYRYSRQTLSTWFTEAGFTIEHLYDYQTGVLGRKKP